MIITGGFLKIMPEDYYKGIAEDETGGCPMIVARGLLKIVDNIRGGIRFFGGGKSIDIYG